jgi:hypothetical protein
VPTPFNQRANNVFLSHSSGDKLEFVDGLYDWMTRCAGLKVWYDDDMTSGQIAERLELGIDSSNAAVLVLSPNSVKSQWVGVETSRFHEEVARSAGDFRIATLRLDGTDAPGLLKAFKHIDVERGALSASAGALLMDTLFGGRDNPTGRPVYVSRGWRPAERPTSDLICDALRYSGLRLISDCTDQPHYDPDRVAEIMRGTGGLVAIMPDRGNGQTSGYIAREVDQARRLGLPVLVFAHREVVLKPEWDLEAPVVFGEELLSEEPIDVADRFGAEIETLVQAWLSPQGGEHIFLGHSLQQTTADAFRGAHHMLSRVTGLPLEVGSMVSGSDAQAEIVRLIRHAGLCIVDISNTSYENLPAKIDFALNSSVEAGIALGADKPLYITCRGQRRTPPFMFRNKQVMFYETDLELVGLLGNIATQHRRRVL